ncbi:MAG: hypothetical protein K2X47_18825 [Bdellovibrionales bacterium]|nr:hypothetical protein [Bdellovibrionales bacterium]
MERTTTSPAGTTEDRFKMIQEYAAKTVGLKVRTVSETNLEIRQVYDQKTVVLDLSLVKDVLERTDTDGKRFLQVNFLDGKKILVTDAFIGFKPVITPERSSEKLPKVVTTSDLISVIEAIEDLSSGTVKNTKEDLDSFRKIYHSIIEGAEQIGFNCENEKNWFCGVARLKASA